ncbi:bifunctional diaminohydroxyphosphoribosylaminopyrimidine deaminase/5-amino-6-(5-phosphoribosylamino)uracil reductase RibD [Emcibacter sp.]|uniref:bifunctional diaminohydroxyphosphoribosylaminopyrimidine deaminase/5-amino-6-(5-phosphoribosylamino)uracil reductase RibD n=1 Tax=Emcibacter sp. TaxID=1979954 RepID=UPI002AA6625C|nr:bifunctional diaminohydroxyphosphoribosylaminopyrimidine deaminase/5-amino-6-(5-phosphoribosylamino)uracil reductase RibD [Emcibacter sp.]
MQKQEAFDRHMMRAALSLARRGLGTVAPNPSVGCILVNDSGHIIGRGWTGAGGRPHAESIALSQAGKAARGATAYVTLEPCAHHGQTPPCAESLVAAGVARVVVATTDPDGRVNGQGLQILEKAGIRVEVGLCQAEAEEVNEGFFNRIHKSRPLVTVKTASTLDGRIALENGESQWITGADSRARGHLYRASHDAILTGIGTVLADNPSLTCRLPGLEDRSPSRIILDRDLKLPLDSDLVKTAGDVEVRVFCSSPDNEKAGKLIEAGVQIHPISLDQEGRLSLVAVMQDLAGLGMTRLLCEGGAKLNASLFKSSLVDRLLWFRAPVLIGEEGIPAIGGLGLEQLEKMPEMTRILAGRTGQDVWEEYRITH